MAIFPQEVLRRKAAASDDVLLSSRRDNKNETYPFRCVSFFTEEQQDELLRKIQGSKKRFGTKIFWEEAEGRKGWQYFRRKYCDERQPLPTTCSSVLEEITKTKRTLRGAFRFYMDENQFFLICFARASWRDIKSKHALVRSDSAAGAGGCNGLSLAVAFGVSGGGFSAFCAVGSKVFNKSNNPKGSMEKILQKYKNFQAKIPKNQAFSIALIDKLIYNRICVSIVDKCIQKRKSLFVRTTNAKKEKSKLIKESLIQ